jgi:hypothetical protein
MTLIMDRSCDWRQHLGIVVAAVKRHAGGVELGSMSASWVAEQRAASSRTTSAERK